MALPPGRSFSLNQNDFGIGDLYMNDKHRETYITVTGIYTKISHIYIFGRKTVNV